VTQRDLESIYQITHQQAHASQRRYVGSVLTPNKNHTAQTLGMADLLTDPSTSFALRERIAKDARRDSLDALDDARALFDLQEKRVGELLGMDAEGQPQPRTL